MNEMHAQNKLSFTYIKHEFVLSFHVYMKTSTPLTFWW